VQTQLGYKNATAKELGRTQGQQTQGQKTRKANHLLVHKAELARPEENFCEPDLEVGAALKVKRHKQRLAERDRLEPTKHRWHP
jgi:hypothetical protein